MNFNNYVVVLLLSDGSEKRIEYIHREEAESFCNMLKRHRITAWVARI